MASAQLIPGWGTRRRSDWVVLLVAFLASAMAHAGTLYAANRWQAGLWNLGKVVCPRVCDEPQPRIEVELAEAKLPPPPPPISPARPKVEPRALVIVGQPKPDLPPPAPKAGKVVLPDEAVSDRAAPEGEITLDRPSLSEAVVVKESETEAPVIASAEIFGRVGEITPGSAGEFGLGGTGTATGIGPFGTGKEGSGEASAGPAPAPAEEPKPVPVKPRGPTRPPRVLNWTDPAYPERARQQGVEGTVVVHLTVDTEGRPQGVRVDL